MSLLPAIINAAAEWVDWTVLFRHQELVRGGFLDKFFKPETGAPNKLHTTASAHQFKEWKGQMDIFFQTSTTQAGILNNYKNILVVGEQKKSYEKGRFKTDFLQLTRYVRKVFADQPTRRFVHAFLLCASKMELWIFDRAGAYSSRSFDIHKKADMFARALVGYATMDAEAMGRDTFIERVIEGGRKNRYITLTGTGGQATRIRLNRAMYSQKAIVSRGTTCYTTENNSVVKFAWASEVAGIVAHHRITTIAEIRKGLQFSKPHPFLNGGDDPSSTSTSTNRPGYKHKLSSDATNNTVSRSNKKQRSDSQKVIRKLSIQPSSSTSKIKPTLSTPNEELWKDRIYSCLVISPAGRVIGEFTNIKQLLESMRNAIKAYQSLFVTGNILHGNISPNNIGHTYCYDLESVACNKKAPQESVFQRWETGSFSQIAMNKEGDMSVTFRMVLEEKILFPYGKDASVNIGAPAGEPDQLYKPIIAAYDETISKL
ncbi:hypothetical protein B0T09DRAFT_354408 [Sordaria sp. MPI-SDFR-AT-0083]|nr:hypothetical protein B0T09DRAFT_354408 [Sordaria sp. MPI-SDFR-AT-0083]